MCVSFIIPHKGREELLERTLQSILDLEFDLQQIEIIVVTQNKTLECAHIDRNKVNFTIIFRSEHETISALRNAGVANTSGDYLAFLDADILLSPNWLDIMRKELHAEPNRVLISAVQRCGPEAGTIEKIRVLLNQISADSPVEFLGGGNLFMSRAIFMDVGGFPENVVTCEDYYFTNKVAQRGQMYRTSKASFVHLGEDKNSFELFRKEIWRGQSNLLSVKGRKIAAREIPSILTPLWQAFCLLSAVLSLLLGKLAFAFLCLLMVCLPTFLYAVRLYRTGKNHLGFIHALWFYCVYHLARIIGTITGIFKTIGT